MAIAKGVMSEDDFLLQEILFNPRTPAHVEGIRTELNELLDIINKKMLKECVPILQRFASISNNIDDFQTETWDDFTYSL